MVFYVGEFAARRAQFLAKKFQKLDASAGVIFISVAAVPTEGGNSNVFDVVIGMGKAHHPSLGTTLVKKVLEDDIKGGITLREITSVVGVAGAACVRDD